MSNKKKLFNVMVQWAQKADNEPDGVHAKALPQAIACYQEAIDEGDEDYMGLQALNLANMYNRLHTSLSDELEA